MLKVLADWQAGTSRVLIAFGAARGSIRPDAISVEDDAVFLAAPALSGMPSLLNLYDDASLRRGTWAS